MKAQSRRAQAGLWRIEGSRNFFGNLTGHFWIGLVLIAIFWPSSWLHLGILGEYAFFPQWLGYILTVDGLVVTRLSSRSRSAADNQARGGSLLTHSPIHFFSLFLLSAPMWWLFEGMNTFTFNWHYLATYDFSFWHALLEGSIDFSTVIPAVFETASLLLTFDLIQRLRFPCFRVRFSRLHAWSLMYLGAGMLLSIMLLPQFAFPFTWGWLFLLADPLNWMRGRPSLLGQFSRGDFRLIAALALGTLTCGFFWELWNFYALPKWYYTVPYIGFAKVFEMPVLGYVGYVPFSWELYALYQFVLGILRVRPPHAWETDGVER